MRYLLCFFWFATLFAELTESSLLRRLEAHLLIDDPKKALFEARKAKELFPGSKEILIYEMKALASLGEEASVLNLYEDFKAKHEEEYPLLEELCWGTLKKALTSTQYNVRLTALVGAFVTNDAKAIPFLLSMMRDSNAVLRAVAVQLSCRYQDAILQKEIVHLLNKEKVWFVRLEILAALGKMKMKESAEKLREIISSEKTMHEEKAIAMEALVQMYEKINNSALRLLSASDRAGLRELACELILHLGHKEAKEILLPLLKDIRYDVRTSAVNAFAMVYLPTMEKKEAKALLRPLMEDSHPIVAITASWAYFFVDAIEAERNLEKWIFDENPENRWLAASAVAKAGPKGVALAEKVFFTSFDPYVKANLALGLIGHRKLEKECCNVLYELLIEEKRQCMWDNSKNALFPTLSPSILRHIDQIPNYPEAVDQMTRLQLLSILAIKEDDRAEEAIRNYLQKKSWGITGVAAATLLQEGNEDSLAIVRELLQDREPFVRIQAALVLAMFGKDPSALDTLKNAYAASDHQMKMYILEALGHIGKPAIVPFLFEALKEPFPILRVIAASSLIQSINH